jgi:deoxyribose-phosphate aldolase
MDINDLVRQITEEVLKKMNGEQGAQSFKSSDSDILKKIDHTLLKPDATRQQVKKVCDEAKQYGFASVCVNPSYVGFVAEELKGTTVAPCCVIGFPLGATMPEVKAFEADAAINAGAKEVDMVINIGAVKSGEWELVRRDIEAVVRASRGRALVKVIIETCLLTDAEKVEACKASKAAGADFVKTSTGFSKGGATVEDVRLMRETVGPNIGVKASGGVRDLKSAMDMVNAGASRLGASSGVEIAKALSGGAAATHTCIGCGNCSKTCPTGRVNIVKNEY